MKSHEFRRALKEGRYTSLGSYPIFYATSDGAALCPGCAKEERAQICLAILTSDTRGGWHVFGYDVNWQDPDFYCGHCNERIESAYAETEEG